MRAEVRILIVAEGHSGTSSQTAALRAPAPARLRLLAALLVAWAVVYLVQYVPARGNGSDFQVFYAGSYADARGVDPFDWPSLWRIEQTLYDGGLGRHGGFVFAPYGDPPPFALVLRPLTLLGESAAYRVWAAFLLGCGLAGAALCLAGWPRRQRWIAALLTAVAPAALFDLRLGQNATPLLLCLGLALALSGAGMPIAAGAALACGLYKPHLMVPVALIVFLAARREDRRALVAGWMAAGAALALIGMAFDGGPGAYGSWLSSARGFGDLIRYQPDLASIPGLYVGWASPALSGALNILCLGLAALIVARLALAARTGGETERQRLLGGGIAAYLALSPYVHTSDQILLALPLLLLIGPDGRGMADTAVLLAAAATLLAPMVVLRDYHTVGINALPPLCVGLAYWLQGTRSMRGGSGDAGDAGVPRAGARIRVPGAAWIQGDSDG